MRFSVYSALPLVLTFFITAELQVEARKAQSHNHGLAVQSRSPVPSPMERYQKRDTKLHKRGILCGLLGLFCTDVSTDVNNCGAIGRKCSATGWTNGNGVATCVNGLCGSGCNSGYAFSWPLMKCISTTNDVNNCGAIGITCSTSSVSPFALTLACVASVCQATTCIAGYNVQNGVCVKNIDITSDVNNCGALGKICPTSYSNGVGSVCSNSVCQPLTCNAGYAFSFAQKQCIPVLTDINNCGSVGNVCSFPNGKASCIGGACMLGSCNTNYYNILGVCTYLDLTSNINNCGAVGTACTFLNGGGSCQNSKCTYTGCASGFKLLNNACVQINTQTDMNNCGSIGNICQSSYLNGGSGSCVNGKCFTQCNSGYTWDSTYQICRLTSSDINNCGGVGVICSPLGSLSSICSNSQCYASVCLSGYELKSGVCYKIDTTSNVNNCGALGAACNFLPAGATGICSNSKCVVTACPAKYTLSSSGVCVAAAVSQRPRVAKRKIIKQTPCPKGETPCPIRASASFELAVTQHFTVAHDEYTGIFAGDGGYECLNTKESLESCGGCASTGEGQDCTAIKGALGVGCDNGSCVVFSCKDGWKPNVRGTKCIRSTSLDGTRKNVKRSNHTSHKNHARHVRAHVHHHAHSTTF